MTALQRPFQLLLLLLLPPKAIWQARLLLNVLANMHLLGRLRGLSRRLLAACAGLQLLWRLLRLIL